jgi:hypothetical protein
MFRLPNDFYLALTHARKATHRGDLAAAKEWTSLVERHLRIAERHEALLQAMIRSTQNRERPDRAPKPKDRTKELGHRNPWVWPKHWTPEQIAEAERQHADETKRKAGPSDSQAGKP